MAVEEYANKDRLISSILKALTLSILMFVNEVYTEQNKVGEVNSTVSRIIQYIRENIKSVTLQKWQITFLIIQITYLI